MALQGKLDLLGCLPPMIFFCMINTLVLSFAAGADQHIVIQCHVQRKELSPALMRDNEEKIARPPHSAPQSSVPRRKPLSAALPAAVGRQV